MHRTKEQFLKGRQYNMISTDIKTHCYQEIQFGLRVFIYTTMDY